MAAAVLFGVLAAVYYFVDPAGAVWMPKCPFRLLTGLDCPACGSQRALHAFLHGHWAEAWRCNPFLAVSLPYLFLVGYTTFRTPVRGWLRFVQHPRVVRAYVVLIVLWWIFRNLPVAG
ncbi:MAG: DUF2752 domain-containing protein [Alistipes sp.]|nr:DUF2752 domain-containing protein [Alistipes sp.]